MMPKFLYTVAAAAVVGFVVTGLYFYGPQKDVTVVPPLSSGTGAWIEVIHDPVNMKTGDAVRTGDRISAGQGGAATVYLPDGSVMRIDSGTDVVVNDLSFDTASTGLVFRIKLFVGRTWSKVMKLATPASAWEVRTDNAVAVVRGTAFSMEYRPASAAQGPISNSAVTEGTVGITALDFATGVPLGAEYVVASGESAVVEAGTVSVGATPSAVPDTGMPAAAAPAAGTRLRLPRTLPGASVRHKAAIRSVTIVPSPPATVTEGDVLLFHAVATAEDGIREDVTVAGVWHASPDIGSINARGAFTAKLSDAISEYGEATGTINFVFKTGDGREMTAKTVPFRVDALVIDDGFTFTPKQ